MNIKKLLIEKERVAYIEHKPELAEFFDLCLQHVIRLEEEINRRDRALEIERKHLSKKFLTRPRF